MASRPAAFITSRAWLDLAAGDDGLDAVAGDGDVAIGEHCVSAIVLADERVAAGDEQVGDGHGRIVG
jgi:hypothetical protein